MALSAVGAAFSLPVGDGEAVCAKPRESRLKTAAIAAAINNDLIIHRSTFNDRLARLIVISSSLALDQYPLGSRSPQTASANQT
jgi:hypothetical protein